MKSTYLAVEIKAGSKYLTGHTWFCQFNFTNPVTNSLPSISKNCMGGNLTCNLVGRPYNVMGKANNYSVSDGSLS